MIIMLRTILLFGVAIGGAVALGHHVAMELDNSNRMLVISLEVVSGIFATLFAVSMFYLIRKIVFGIENYAKHVIEIKVFKLREMGQIIGIFVTSFIILVAFWRWFDDNINALLGMTISAVVVLALFSRVFIIVLEAERTSS